MAAKSIRVFFKSFCAPSNYSAGYSNGSIAKSRRQFLRNIFATALLACLLGIASLGAGICQTYGYGDKPDQWAPYESGRYFQQLQTIEKIYRFDGGKISYLHFEETDVGVEPVDLFRIPARHQDCGKDDCYFFVLIASGHSDTPYLTFCQFKQAALSHVFNPDGSRFFGFEFECEDTFLDVKVTPSHLMGFSRKTP